MSYVGGTATSSALMLALIDNFLSGLSSPWIKQQNSTDILGVPFRDFSRTGGDASSVAILGPVNQAVSPFIGSSITGFLISPHTFFYDPMAGTWYNQPGAPYCADLSTPCAGGMGFDITDVEYHFFSDASDDNIVIVAKLGEIYNYISFGIALDKQGTWVGKLYVVGARSAYIPMDNDSSPPPAPFYDPRNFSGAIRGAGMIRMELDSIVDFPNVDNKTWVAYGLPGASSSSRTVRSLMGTGYGEGPLYGNTSGGHVVPPTGRLFVASKSARDGNIILHRNAAMVERTTGRFSLIGYHPLMASVYSRGQLPDGSEITVGSDTWKCFGSFAVKKVP